MDGCLFGISAVQEIICDQSNRGSSQELCTNLQQRVQCERACQPYSFQLPRPTLKNVCVDNCLSSLQDSCVFAVSVLNEVTRK